MKINIDQPSDEINDTQCLVCKKPTIQGEEVNKGKNLTIQNRDIWICKECLAPFERGRRIGQIELNSKVVNCLQNIDDSETGWRLKEKILEIIPASKRNSFIKNHMNNPAVPSPRDIFAAIENTVIGQSTPKKIMSIAVHEHYSDLSETDIYSVPNPHHVLMIGPSGSGKTLLANTIASKLDVPFVSADSTIFSPTGFQGADVDTIVMEMVQKSKGISTLAERGLVFIDEIDKLAAYHHEGKSEVMTKSTQSSLLRLVEGRQVRLAKDPHDSISVHTGKMLFFFGGAFIGLSDIVAKKMGYTGKQIGLRASIGDNTEYEKAVKTHEILSQAPYDILLESLEEYGILTELLGRIPSIVALAPLTKEELRKILLNTTHSPLKIQKKLFANSGYNLIFTEDFIEACIDKAFGMATGARALKSIVRNSVSEAAFDLLGEFNEDFDDDSEIINFKGTIIIESKSLKNPNEYQLKEKFIEDKNVELTATL